MSIHGEYSRLAGLPTAITLPASALHVGSNVEGTTPRAGQGRGTGTGPLIGAPAGVIRGLHLAEQTPPSESVELANKAKLALAKIAVENSTHRRRAPYYSRFTPACWAVVCVALVVACNLVAIA